MNFIIKLKWNAQSKNMPLVGFPSFLGLKVLARRSDYRVDTHTIKRGY